MRLLPLLACLTALPCAAQSTAPAPVSAFTTPDQFYRPRMSPDGKHLAVTVRMPIGKRLVPVVNFYSLPDLKLESTVRLKVYEVPVNYYWVSDTRLVLEKGQELGSREAPRATGEVMAMDYDGSKQAYLYGYEMFKFGVGTRHDDDYGYGYVAGTPEPLNNHVLLGSQLWRTERSELIDIDTKSGIRKLRASLPVSGLRYVTQLDGTPRFAWGNREDNSFVLMRYDEASEKWNAFNRVQAGGELRPLAITPDNNEFMAWYSQQGAAPDLVRENIATGERRVVAHENSGVMSAMWGSHPGLPIAAISQNGKPHVTYFDPEDADVKLHQALSQQFPDALVTFIDFTRDGGKLIFSVTSDRDPGAFYLYDRKTNRADVLLLAMEGIEPEQMAKRRPVTFKARDGLVLQAYLTLPNGVPARKLPLVLIPHGGPHGPFDRWFFDPDAQFLASRGYAVLQVNFRGSGGRGPGFQVAGYRQWGGKIMDDLVDGVKWAVDKGIADGNRMCVFGASFGGYASLMLASREPDLFKCAVGYAGVYDLPYIYKEDATVKSTRNANWYRRYIGEDAAELARFSPASQAQSIKAPVLLIHGGKDEVAPKEHAFRMRDALVAAGKPPEWMYVDYEGHGFYDTENLTAVYQKLEEFLKKNIGAR